MRRAIGPKGIPGRDSGVKGIVPGGFRRLFGSLSGKELTILGDSGMQVYTAFYVSSGDLEIQGHGSSTVRRKWVLSDEGQVAWSSLGQLGMAETTLKQGAKFALNKGEVITDNLMILDEATGFSQRGGILNVVANLQIHGGARFDLNRGLVQLGSLTITNGGVFNFPPDSLGLMRVESANLSAAEARELILDGSIKFNESIVEPWAFLIQTVNEMTEIRLSGLPDNLAFALSASQFDFPNNRAGFSWPSTFGEAVPA